MKPIALDPIKRMKLNDTIVLPGYQTGDDFVRTIASMDVNVFLVPGTDGSCRAVREAMAMGVPIIASQRGILPELVGDGERGLVIDDTPENLANAIIELAHDRERRIAFGQHAKQFAREHFSLDRQADIVGSIYRELMERGKR
jgi:glycosyltransferase involved in cell wall biosynthesis